MNNILDKLSSTSDAFPDKIAFAFIRKGNKKKTDSISFRELATKKNPEQSQTRGGNRKRSLARNSQDSPSRTQKVEDNKRPKSEEILL